MGGLGLTSAVATATPTYWASWADVLPVLQAQAPQHATAIHHMLTHPPEATPGIQTAIHSAEQLRELGWEPRNWRQLLAREALPDLSHDFEGPTLGSGWQQTAARACQRTHRTAVTQALDPPSQALLESQTGPHASRPFTTIPYNPTTTSEFFCSAACGFLFPCLPVTAGAVALLTFLATTVQLARRAALHAARRNKEKTYPELVTSWRCRLIVLGIEVGGRWSQEAATFIRLLAKSKPRQAPAILQRSVATALIARWSAMLTQAAMQTFAASFLDFDLSAQTNVDAPHPSSAPSRLA
eukprot:s469_g39.t1